MPSVKYISFCFLIIGLQKLNNAKFELHTFTAMKKRFEEYAYKNIDFANDDLTEKLVLLSDIEDKSYFDREKSFNLISIEFIKYRLHKSTLYKEKQKGYANTEALIKRALQVVRNDMKNGLVLRGYSTIEMQLIKNIGIKRGFLRKKYLVARKIYELLYTKIFFTGLRQYYESNQYGKKEYFKKFIAYVYLHNVPTMINGKKYSKFVEAFNGKKIEEVSMNAMFVACLGLNTRNIYRSRVELYEYMFERHGLNIETVLEMADTKQLV